MSLSYAQDKRAQSIPIRRSTVKELHYGSVTIPSPQGIQAAGAKPPLAFGKLPASVSSV